MKAERLIMIGPPGAGKGTTSEQLAATLNVPHVSTGEMFRSHMERKTEIGVQIDYGMKHGQLVSDDMTNEMVKGWIDPDRYILDGYPRNSSQAQFLLSFSEPQVVVSLEASDEVVMGRLLRRKRNDDLESVIVDRLSVFYNETMPSLDVLQAAGLVVIRIDANHSVKETFNSLCQALSQHFEV